jgi:hypothetical protein
MINSGNKSEALYENQESLEELSPERIQAMSVW